MTTYDEIIAKKEQHAPVVGFDADVTDEWLFPFQRHAVKWALLGGRRALFMDTGLGKSRMQLRWADAVASHTDGRILILAPLAVGPQTVGEALAVGLCDITFARSMADVGDARIIVTNYDSLDKFSGLDVAGVVLDESSILKSFMGRMRTQIIERFSDVPYKLACTATPAPNDFDELGNHSEFLGVGTRLEMLSQFFLNDTSDTGTWRLKGHAVIPFWDWVASWALCAGMPSDVGNYDDSAYILPPLNLRRHIVNVDIVSGAKEGAMFRLADMSATNIHAEKRLTTEPRADAVAAIVAAEPDEPWIVWCETNYEAEAIMARLPKFAVEVSGSMSVEVKSSRLLGFSTGGGILLTKSKIAGFGMNWQHCARVAFIGTSFSYEAFYQAIRRCWRFGQKRPVEAHVVLAYTDQATWDVVSAKGEDHADMKRQMFAASRRAQNRAAALRSYNPTCHGRLPSWLHSLPTTTEEKCSA